jgi:cysteinyl-tRNA synthetase
LVSGEEQKEDPLDFVLWKPKKDGEPYWDSFYCQGRPGWHIECSAMSRKYLGETIDIHAGGEDLIFPHHENEIAQSESCSGQTFARYWMHNAFLNIDNKKMSKSTGNFFTVRDILRRYEPMVLRFFMLSAHYRSPLNFSDELMESAKNSLDRIRTCVDKLTNAINMSEGTMLARNEYAIVDGLSKYKMQFEEAMGDDNNTATAISTIFELVKYINVNMIEMSTKEGFTRMKDMLLLLCDILGLIVEKKEEVLDEDIEKLIDERQKARTEKNFARADEIRKQLLDMGIVLEDTREGVTWKRA